MTRLPALTYDAANQAQRELWDAIIESRGKALELTAPDGSLAGPFGAFIRRPQLGQPLVEVGAQIRFNSTLEPRLLELAITAVGAHWKSEFEFWAHSNLARQAGIAQATIDALAAGRDPELEESDEQAVYNYTTALLTSGRVRAPIHDAAVAAVGIDGVVDLTHTIGYYCQISFILNAFEVPLPEGVTAVWPDVNDPG